MPVKQQPTEIDRPVEMRRTIESKPVDLNILLYILVAICVAVAMIIGGGYLLMLLVEQQFGAEGVRVVMIILGISVMYMVISWTHAKMRRDNLHDLTEVQRVAVQSIIQHQAADDRGEVMRDLVPTAFRVMAENQNRGQQLAADITRHARFLSEQESKAARNTRPALPFDIGASDDDMEEII